MIVGIPAEFKCCGTNVNAIIVRKSAEQTAMEALLKIEITFLLLFCRSILQVSSDIYFCVRNSGNNCSVFTSPSRTIQISELEGAIKKSNNKTNITVYLSSGEHELNKTLTISSSIIHNCDFIGSSNNTQRSVIKCDKFAGFMFRSMPKYYGREKHFLNVTIKNVILDNCMIDEENAAALFFQYYINYVLDNVMVINSPKLGLLSTNCHKQKIVGCHFYNNAHGHLNLEFNVKKLSNESRSIIIISDTNFQNTTSTSILISSNKINLGIHLSACNFSSGLEHLKFEPTKSVNSSWKYKLSIQNCHFTGRESGISVVSHQVSNDVMINASNNTFMGFNKYAISLYNIRAVDITNSHISYSRLGISYVSNSTRENLSGLLKLQRSNLSYCHTALYANLTVQSYQLLLQDCVISFNHPETQSSAIKLLSTTMNNVSLMDSRIENNYNYEHNFNCSTLEAEGLNIYTQNTFIRMNNCTGMTLLQSNLLINETLTLSENWGILGGGLRLVPLGPDTSIIFLQPASKLVLLNNTAFSYGGGLYVDKECHQNSVCFFKVSHYTDRSIILEGNRATNGGNDIFGSCLQQCLLTDNHAVNLTDPRNIFWNITYSDNNVLRSASSIVEKPSKVAFCTNRTSTLVPYTTCHELDNISVYRGEKFELTLMISDNYCFASTGIIQAKVKRDMYETGETAILENHQTYQFSDKFCSRHEYVLKAPASVTEATLEFYVNGEQTLHQSPPSRLDVVFLDCPLGFVLNASRHICDCTEALEHIGIECHPSDYSFIVPAMTWMGEVNGKLGVHQFCRRCHTTGKQTIRLERNGQTKLPSRKGNNSRSLCQPNRSGKLCGRCEDKFSLKLGGYNCGSCQAATYKGILLILLFIIGGVFLSLLLLKLNFTISTGLINGLIFYSNIVYSNSDDYLKTSPDSNSHLNNAVQFFYTYQAWLNLDFGINVCFFEGYDQYIATWMQFMFPLYLWLLITITVIVSRFSSRLSKFTGNGTVPALATLFLLSYTKLLTASIAATSYTKLSYLNTSNEDYVWIEDSTVSYLTGKHVPLFVVSIILLAFYFFPFSLLLISGPLLQSHSHYRLLDFVNKIKPFLDSFYGPHNDAFRFWPGLLLLTRVVLLNIFAFYSLGDRNFKLAYVTVMIALLLLVLWLMGKSKCYSLYRNRVPNYLELFFLFNLIIYSIVTLYFSQNEPTVIYKQQIATCIFVGSAFLVTCCILVYHFAVYFKELKCARQQLKFRTPQNLFALKSSFQPTTSTSPNDLDNNQVHRKDDVGTYNYIPLREPLIQTST